MLLRRRGVACLVAPRHKVLALCLRTRLKGPSERHHGRLLALRARSQPCRDEGLVGGVLAAPRAVEGGLVRDRCTADEAVVRAVILFHLDVRRALGGTTVPVVGGTHRAGRLVIGRLPLDEHGVHTPAERGGFFRLRASLSLHALLPYTN